MNRIITVGRSFGSGGREVGKRLAQYLNIAYYDHEIITEIAKRMALDEAYIDQIIEQDPVQTLLPITIGRSFYPGFTLQNDPHYSAGRVFAEQADLLKDLADRSDCVIVGRCADFILADYQPFRIFVYAD